MANITTDQLKERFDRMMRDTQNKTYQPDEKVEALMQAIDDDPQVFVILRDDETEVEDGTNVYDLAENCQELLELAVDIRGDGYPITLDRTSYEVINGQIWFRRDRRIPKGTKLVQIAKQKLYYGNSIPDYLVGYVLHNAAAYLLELLIHDKTGRFLKNDTSLAEITAAIQNHRQVAARYQRTLPNRNQTVL